MDIKFSDPGEGLDEGLVLHFLVAKGETVKANAPLVEIETAKSVVEIPSPIDGILEEWLIEEKQVIQVGVTLCKISPV